MRRSQSKISRAASFPRERRLGYSLTARARKVNGVSSVDGASFSILPPRRHPGPPPPFSLLPPQAVGTRRTQSFTERRREGGRASIYCHDDFAALSVNSRRRSRAARVRLSSRPITEARYDGHLHRCRPVNTANLRNRH